MSLTINGRPYGPNDLAIPPIFAAISIKPFSNGPRADGFVGGRVFLILSQAADAATMALSYFAF
jgi:hypothetical protein